MRILKYLFIRQAQTTSPYLVTSAALRGLFCYCVFCAGPKLDKELENSKPKLDGLKQLTAKRGTLAKLC